MPAVACIQANTSSYNSCYNLSTLCKKELSSSFYQMIKKNKNKKKETEQTITMFFSHSKVFARVNILLIILVYMLL